MVCKNVYSCEAPPHHPSSVRPGIVFDKSLSLKKVLPFFVLLGPVIPPNPVAAPDTKHIRSGVGASIVTHPEVDGRMH